MNLTPRRLAAGLLLLLMTSCSLAPEYRRPEMPVPASLPAGENGAQTPVQDGPPEMPAADLGWRDYFTDPVLQRLIAAALANNRDLRQSALAVETYQAQYRIQRAALFPAIAGAASGAKQRTFSGGGYATSEVYAASVGITAYELDLFGRIRNLKEDALEQYLALAETNRSARISLIAEVAKAYLTLLADREMQSITEKTLRTEEESYALVERRTAEGIADRLALAQARTALETAKGNLALYRRQVAQDLNGLTLLAGGPVPAAVEASVLSDQLSFPDLPLRLSSEALLLRPDIQAAEHQLLGAHANIGAARAAFFPSISLTATAGTMSADLSTLFENNTGVWSFAPSINLPIFTAGRLKAQLDIAEIRRESAVAAYEKTIQTAFREVADALVAQETYRDQLTAQKANLEASLDSFSIAGSRYKEGMDSYLTLLDAQRSLYAARQGYISLRLAQLVNQVTLYKVLGGGWKEKS